MTYLLDTSACVDYLRRPDSVLRRWIPADGVLDSLRLCSVVRAELRLGVRKRPTERNRRNVSEFLALFDSYPFDDDAAEAYADLRADLERQGRVIGPNDMLIAAIAVARAATLVTGNPKEFVRVAGLSCLSLDDLAAGKTRPA